MPYDLNRSLFIGALVLLWAGYFVLMANLHSADRGGGIDYEPYHEAAQALASGGNPYNLPESRRPYLYPPLTGIMLVPLASQFSFKTASIIWLGLNMLLLLLALFLLTKGVENRHLKILVWVAPVFFAPTLMSLLHGQITIMLLLLIVAAWYALQKGHLAAGGAVLSLAAWIKVYPVVLVAYFVWKREWRVVAGSLIAALSLLLFQLLAANPHYLEEYISNVFPNLAVSGQPYLNYLNGSIQGFTGRLFVTTQMVIPIFESEALFQISNLGLKLLTVGITIIAVSRKRYRDTAPHQQQLEFCLVLTAGLLISPTLWESGMLPLLLVLIVLLQRAFDTSSRLLAGISLIAALFMNMQRVIWEVWHEQTLPALVLSFPFFGTLLVWGVLVALNLHAVQQGSTAPDTPLVKVS